jgi:hypothetical protein
MPPDLVQIQSDFAAALAMTASGPLAVYRNTVIRGAVEALRANYPVVEQIVGEELFEVAAVDFAAAHPPQSPVLAHYGRAFADWICDQPWAADLPYLSDVARVERLHTECLLAADAEPLPELPRTAQSSSGQVALHPAVRFAWLATPAMSIWLAHQQPIAADIQPEWKAEGALFSRPTPFVVHAPRIGRAAHRLLAGMQIGETLAAATAAAERLYPEEDVLAVLASLANLGVFAAHVTERIVR